MEKLSDREVVWNTYPQPEPLANHGSYLRESHKGHYGMSTILHVLLDQVVQKLDVDAARIFLSNARKDELWYAAGSGFRQDDYDAENVQFGEELSGQVALRNRPFFTKDLSHPAYSLMQDTGVEGERFSSYCGVPFTMRGRLKGVLEVFQRQPFTMSKSWFDILNDLAGKIAIVVYGVEQFNRILIADDESDRPPIAF